MLHSTTTWTAGEPPRSMRQKLAPVCAVDRTGHCTRWRARGLSSWVLTGWRSRLTAGSTAARATALQHPKIRGETMTAHRASRPWVAVCRLAIAHPSAASKDEFGRVDHPIALSHWRDAAPLQRHDRVLQLASLGTTRIHTPFMRTSGPWLPSSEDQRHATTEQRARISRVPIALGTRGIGSQALRPARSRGSQSRCPGLAQH